jgi:hypothetical protein
MGSESSILTPECVECHRVWLPSDPERWKAYLTHLPDEERPEHVFYCPTCAKREFGAD